MVMCSFYKSSLVTGIVEVSQEDGSSRNSHGKYSFCEFAYPLPLGMGLGTKLKKLSINFNRCGHIIIEKFCMLLTESSSH